MGPHTRVSAREPLSPTPREMHGRQRGPHVVNTYGGVADEEGDGKARLSPKHSLAYVTLRPPCPTTGCAWVANVDFVFNGSPAGIQLCSICAESHSQRLRGPPQPLGKVMQPPPLPSPPRTPRRRRRPTSRLPAIAPGFTGPGGGSRGCLGRPTRSQAEGREIEPRQAPRCGDAGQATQGLHTLAFLWQGKGRHQARRQGQVERPRTITVISEC